MSDRSTTDRSTPAHDAQRVGNAPFGVRLGLVLNAFVAAMLVLTMLPMLFIATPGVGIRPMGQAVLIFLAGIIGLFVGVPASVVGIFLGRGRQGWLGVLGVLLNLIILPIGVLTMVLLAWAMGLTLES